MAKIKYRTRYVRVRSRRRSKPKIPVATMVGFSIPIMKAVSDGMNNGWQAGLDSVAKSFTGFDLAGNFNIENLKNGLLPVVAGGAVSILASKLGINRRLRIPYIKI